MNGRERGFLLLTSSLGDPARHPLTAPQLRMLTRRMRDMKQPDEERELTSADLTTLGYSCQMAQRILRLLGGGAVLDYYLQKGQKAGCVPVTRVSGGYPILLRKRLGEESPGCLWAKGDLSLLEKPGIALVGNRELQPENRAFAREVGRQAARQGFVLISGNARGADREAQDACLDAGGCVVSVVADELEKWQPRQRQLYLSEDGFDLPFSAQRAISRNRVIHALGWRTLVAQVGEPSGGTWDGSVKNLRFGWSPLFCFDDGSAGMRMLMDMGADSVSMEMLKDFGSLEQNIRTFFDQ